MNDPGKFPNEYPPGFSNAPCPWLPQVAAIHDFQITRRHGGDRGAAFYQDALRYAQSQWCAGKPAQAVLQLDKAWLADLPPADPVLVTHPPPYRALAWILCRAAGGSHGYLGNPVRHFQHLASRMSGGRREIRAWRAWFCMHLAERTQAASFPRDGRQLAREGLFIPSMEQALARISRLGWHAEARLARSALDG